MRRSVSSLFLLTVMFGGCSSQKVGLTAPEATAESSNSPTSPFTIVALRVEADSLIAELRYGGGFRAHEFTLVSNGAATKSLPRQQPLRITHNAQGDVGRALITSRQSFDLTPFRDPSQTLIRLAVKGWPDRVDYPYNH